MEATGCIVLPKDLENNDDAGGRQLAVVVVLRVLKNFKSFSEAEYYMKSKIYTD
jgi:hypothetical protein